MLNCLARVRRSGVVVLPALAFACATTSATTPAPIGSSAPAPIKTVNTDPALEKHVAVDMPAEAADVRTNGKAPILSVVTIEDVIYLYVYGYPLYPEGDAARGIAELRKAAAEGAKHSKISDKDGVVHIAEELPAIGCRFDGIREAKNKFVPVSLTCELPAPNGLGGANRPVLGAIAVGAKVEDILKEPTVVENFLGAFHLTSDDFADGSGTGFFNTTHGQVAMVFKGKKLDHFVYYFDPNVAGWQDQKLWEGVL